MYNAGVSPEALQQVKNEGQREAVRENGNTKIFNNTKPPFFAMSIKHIEMAESKRLWKKKRTGEEENLR